MRYNARRAGRYSGECSVRKSGGRPATPRKRKTSPIAIVWYPSASAADYRPARNEFAGIITRATGRQAERKLTAGYAVANESLAVGSADIRFMGAASDIEEKTKTRGGHAV